MSTTVNPDDKSVTVPISPTILQNLAYQVAKLSQIQGQAQGQNPTQAQAQVQKAAQIKAPNANLNSSSQKKDGQPGQAQPKGSQVQTRPLNSHQTKSQNIQNKPQTLQTKPVVSTNTQAKTTTLQAKTSFSQNKNNSGQGFNAKKDEIMKVEDVKAEQEQQNSSIGTNALGQAQLAALMAQIQQLGQGGGNNLLTNLLAQSIGNQGGANNSGGGNSNYLFNILN